MILTKNTNILLLGLIILALLGFSYSNHFNNGFYFDDSHVIVSNGAIKDLSNWVSFFTDPTTFSSLPANQAYRPLVTLMDAFDYWMAGNELNPFYFHVHIFFWYLVQCILMFVLFKNIIYHATQHKWSDYIALFAVGWYALHAANAETINYVSARSDSFSTLCIVATLVLYQNRKARKYFYYLIPLVLGIYTKQTGAMAFPLLFLYVFFFENKDGTPLERITLALKRSAPAGIFVISLFLINQLYLTPESTVSSNTQVSRWDYFTTQWYIVTHYLKNFLIPLDLSADPDFVVIKGLFHLKKMLGLMYVSILLTLAYRFFKKQNTRPISFGILWFFIALLPTSSFVPLYQIANDHRTFFPYIGLVLAISHGLGLLIINREASFSKSIIARVGLVIAVIGVLSAHGYGTYQRNIVWNNSESLWYDVTIKSPNNARGLMNYGNAMMAKGKYDEALSYFQRTLDLWPTYSYAHVNMGVLLGAKGMEKEAETYFNNGIRYGKNNPEAYYFFANWLIKKKRYAEAQRMLENALSVSPMHTKSIDLLEKVRALAAKDGKELLRLAESRATKDPNYENWINLSLAYYKAKKWKDCINAANSALELKPNDPGAYNNICTACIQLGLFDKAIENCNKAIAISPNYQLAKNNLKWAHQSKAAVTEAP